MKALILTLLTALYISYPVLAQNEENLQCTSFLNEYDISKIADAGDYLWLATTQQVIKFEKETGIVSLYDSDEFNIPPNRHWWINTIVSDKNGLPWVGTVGTHRLTAEGEWVLMQPGDTEAILPLQDSAMLVSSGGDLIKIQDNGQNDIYDLPTVMGDIKHSLTVDKEGNLWGINYYVLAMYSELLKFDWNVWTTYQVPGYKRFTFGIWPPDNDLLWLDGLIIDADDTKWMIASSMFDGCDKLVAFSDSSWFEYDFPSGIDQYNVRDLALANNGIWAATSSGLLLFENQVWKKYKINDSDLYTNSINCIHIDENSIMWLGTEGGLLAINNPELLTSNDFISKKNQTYFLFPNPAWDYITLETPNDVNYSIIWIYNMLGKPIKMINTDTDSDRIDISFLSAGYYILVVQLDDGSCEFKKFMKY